MLIAHLTDIHIGFDPAAKPKERNLTRFKAVLKRLAASPDKPDFMVLSGDLTDHGDRESYERIVKLLRPFNLTVLPLVGNHDTREELLTAFPATAFEGNFVHYVVQKQGLRIICLDTLEVGRQGGSFCKARRDWLRRTLRDGAGAPCVIFMHHPPIVSGIDWLDPSPDAEWIANLAAAVKGHERSIKAIHCGHLHRPIVTQFNGIPLAVTPSVAPPVALDLRPVDENRTDGRALITTEPPAYALHRWDGENLVTHYETCGDWSVLAHYGKQLQPMIRELIAERN